MAAKKRFDAIQTLRFMCFLIVFAEHSGFYEEFHIQNYGEMCIMSVFLMMSGFLMVYSYIDRETPASIPGCFRFTVGKIKKLYPLHVETATIQLIMELIFLAELIREHLEWLWGYLFRFGVNLCLMQAWVPDFKKFVFSFNGPSWFLSVMLFAYFMFPLILKLLKKLKDTKKILIFTAGIIIISYAAELIVGINTEWGETFTWFTNNSPIMRTVDFYLGCVIGYIYVGRRKEADIDGRAHSKVKWTAIETIVILMFYFGSFFIGGGIILALGDIGKSIVFCTPVFAALFAVPMLMIFVYERGFVTKALTWKPLVYLGNISMYTYLIHYLFTQGWSYIVQKNGIVNSGPTRALAIAVMFVLTIGLSALYDKFRKYRAAKAKEKAKLKAAQ
jgi:peptidoglycan/LPS O-acetylase OafA/YrhL